MPLLEDKNLRNKILLSVDIIMFIVVIISIAFTLINFYNAGYYSGDLIKSRDYLIHGYISIAFLSVSMTWIFIRFFRNWGKRLI